MRLKWKQQYYRYAVLCLAVVAGLVLYAVNRGTPPSKPDEKDKQPRISIKDNELDLLARAVHAEAKGEPYEGMVAVAAVILNRVDHPEFPNTIAGVIYEPLAFQVVANGTINQEPDEAARQAAYEALHGLDPTNGALYFYNPNKTQNRWIRSRPVMKTIGKHIFAG
ncbi:MAG: cell wall hydrolase [Candidatus Wallacebacter cryptica]